MNQKHQIKIPIKVLLLPKFEIGDITGDTIGEAQLYYEGYLAGGYEYQIDGVPNPLYVKDGVALNVTGMGKAQTAASLTAILSDKRFDWTGTYIISTGCCGGPVSEDALGDVVLGYELVDIELGHVLLEGEYPDGGVPFVRDTDFDSAGYIKLNSDLVDRAYNLVKNVTLYGTERAREVMELYGAERLDPKVQLGTNATGDNFWSGDESRGIVDYILSVYGVKYPYKVTEMEDVALGMVVTRFGMLDRFLTIRDIVDIDVHPPGVSVYDLWAQSSSSGQSYDWGIFTQGMKNNYLVGKEIVDAILAGRL